MKNMMKKMTVMAVAAAIGLATYAGTQYMGESGAVAGVTAGTMHRTFMFLKDAFGAPLKNPRFFRQVHAECGTLVWDNAIDVAPESIWEDSVKV